MSTWNEGEPPKAGIYEVEGRGRQRLYMLASGTWMIGDENPYEWECPIEAAGLSIKPRDGLMVLRWRPVV